MEVGNEIDWMFMKIKEFFRRDPKTTWGKNELVKQLDHIHDKYFEEKDRKLSDLKGDKDE